MGQLSVSRVGKAFRRYRHPIGRIAEWLGMAKQHEQRWVLRDISFEIAPGDAVALIGVNGAGKSTLLKLIAGTSAPTEGHIQTSGRLTALLELGMGFHPDFTGRENARMAARLSGVEDQDLPEVLAAVEEFAEIGDYIDQPLRVYSSGMQVRLAFSVATAVRPDILIIDEALSVGDTYFQHKSFDRIRRFLSQGTTLLFVSHSPSAIKSICHRALLLDQGSIIKDGEPDQVLDYYNAIIARSHADYQIRALSSTGGAQGMRSGSGEAAIDRVEMRVNGSIVHAIQSGQRASLLVHATSRTALEQLTVGILIRDRFGNDVFGTNSMLLGVSCARAAGESFVAEFIFDSLPLGKGSYSVTVALHREVHHIADNYDWWDRAMVLEVVADSASGVGVCHFPVTLHWHSADNGFEPQPATEEAATNEAATNEVATKEAALKQATDKGTSVP